MSTDVLDRVVEVVTGKSLGEVLDERIIRPLGMADTGFSATGDKAARVAEPLVDKATGKKPPMRNVTRESRWQSGGGGLTSTASDYLRFCQMLLNGGELDGVRIVSPKTVAHMASDHLPPDVQFARLPGPGSALWHRCRRWGMALVSASRCARPRACRLCRVRSASFSGVVRPAPIFGSTRKSR